MFRATVLAATSMIAAGFMAATASAADYGTAAEASALLGQAVIEMKTDPAAAIVKFNDPDGGFRDRDLYVFCSNVSDGVLVAHPKLVGTDLRTIKDVDGKPFGAEILDTAREGEVTAVAYMWPRPGSDKPVQKNSYVIRLTDYVCGVGYYE